MAANLLPLYFSHIFKRKLSLSSLIICTNLLAIGIFLRKLEYLLWSWISFSFLKYVKKVPFYLICIKDSRNIAFETTLWITTYTLRKSKISSYQGNNTNKTAVNCSLHYSFNKMLIDRKAHISCYWYTDLNWHPGWEDILLSTCLLPRDFPQHTASQRTVFTLFSHQWEGARSKGDLSDEPWLVWQSRL